ncbi:Terminase-6C domain-containing protein [Candidatus Ornithobacterium hominis]|uniref:phage terminase large subunit n=1 Tax=Candidatus Ornithobacterium hominis TaxID=2497989 RepID=UPI0024BD2CE5|nr:phage terminase large subunit [Candidatus Ornithobacterium hominis]CAI9429707.1 Terminase-6C domain-containing protein [Candidatus Ornithobacterium hominis]
MSEIFSKQLQKLIEGYDEHCKQLEKKTKLNYSHRTPQERRDYRNWLEEDYVRWFEEMFPQYAKKPCAWFHREMAEKLIHNPICFLLGEIYRSGAKSVHLDLGIPLYLYVTGELHFMLLVGQTEPKAKKLIRDIQSQLTHNQRFIYFYGKKHKNGDWADGDFKTADGVKFMALGAEQSPRGLREEAERPDYIVVDDVDTRQRVRNERLSKELFDYVWEDLVGTFDEGGSRQRFVCANNNFHKNTLINQLKEHFQTLNERLTAENLPSHYYTITVPAVKSLETFEPNWPEKTSANYWRKKYIEKPYRSFMREYMHKHITEGAIFKNDEIQYKEMLPLEVYDALIFYGDLSYKDAGDYKSMVFCGKYKREFHVIDAIVRQTSRHNVALWLYETVEDNNLLSLNISYMIEGLFAMDEFVNDFDLVGDTKGWYVPVISDEKSKSGKFERIESMQGYFQRGNVWFNEQKKRSNDFVTLIEQILAFQKGSGAHDDGPDSLQSAIQKLNTAAIINKIPPKTMSRKEMATRSKNRF